MFRATSHVLAIRTLLYRRHPVDVHLAAISRFPTSFKNKSREVRVREPCPKPPPPPPPPPKDDRLLWGTLALLLIAGGAIVVAKGSPEIRDWLTINAPWFDDIIAIVYQENMSYGEFILSCIDDTKRYIVELTSDKKPKRCALGSGGKAVTYDVPEEPKAVKGDGTELVCEPEPPPVVTQDICEIEKCLRDLSEGVVAKYCAAKEACKKYNKLVEDTMVKNFTYAGMKGLRPAMKERKDIIKESFKTAEKDTAKLDEMVKYLDCGVQATKEQIDNVKMIYRDYHKRFKAAKMEFQWEDDKSVVCDRQWQMVEALIDKYTSENEAMYPGLKYGKKMPNVPGDPDVLLYNSYRYIHHLQENLKKYSNGMTDRVSRAIENLPKDADSVKARQASLKAAVKEKRGDLEKEFKKREDDLKEANEKYLKEQFRKQLLRHEDSLAKRLAAKEQEVENKFDVWVAEKVAAEKRLFDSQLEDMAWKLNQVEQQLSIRLKAEKETRRSQELWAAGSKLLEATKNGDSLVKVDKQIKAIEKASGEDDKLIETVLSSISKKVREKGILPETALRSSFNVMEKTCRSVALVEQDGAPLPVYIMSWLQGLLLFMKISGIPQNEFEKPPLEPDPRLDTFDLLQRARFWMDRGNLAIAVRYISSLQGASRAAANKWLEATRAHLEVRQAAEAVLAHAAALGLQYL